MKLVLIGDPHFANRPMFGRETPTPGVNTRLRAVSRTLNWIRDQIKEQDIVEVAILGDITHEHGRLTPPVLQEVLEVFWLYNEKQLALTALAGNHDLDAHGHSIVGAFANHGYDGYGVLAVDVAMQAYFGFFPQPVHGIPYGSGEYALNYLKVMTEKDEPAIVLMHHSFEGAKHGAHEFEPPGGIAPSLIPENIRVYSGHYHLRQRLAKNVLYIGAPLQHDFGEAAYIPGYTILDFDEVDEEGFPTYTFYEVPAEVAPRFHILPHNLQLDELPGLVESDYYRIDLPVDVDPGEVADLRNAVTNVIIKPIPITTDIRSRVEEHLGEKGERVEFIDVMEAYAAMNADTEERSERLFALGKDIAQSVLGEEYD